MKISTVQHSTAWLFVKCLIYGFTVGIGLSIVGLL